MSQSEDILLIVRAALAIIGGVVVIHGILSLEVAYQASNPIYSGFSCIIEIFVGLALIVVVISKKPEKALETIADFLRDALDSIF
jgi:type IV secretory pathway TrbL component